MKKGGGWLEYFDTSGALVMKCHVTGSTTCKIFGPDGASLAAVVTGIYHRFDPLETKVHQQFVSPCDPNTPSNGGSSAPRAV